MGASEPAPAEARCAQHPTIAARATCPRCGAFVCGLCSGTAGDERCTSCREREPKRAPAPWEDPGERTYVGAFFRTAGRVLLSPKKFFGGLQLSGPWQAALTFGVIALILRDLTYVLDGVIATLREDPAATLAQALTVELRERAYRILGYPLSLLFMVGMLGISRAFFGKALLPGGGATRLVSYSAAVHLFALPLNYALLFLPLSVGITLGLVLLAQTALMGVGLVYGIGEHPVRATLTVLAASIPQGLITLLALARQLGPTS